MHAVFAGAHTVPVTLLEFLSQPQDRLGAHLCAKVSVKGCRSATLESNDSKYNGIFKKGGEIMASFVLLHDSLTCCMCPRTFLRQSKTPLPSSEYRLKMKSVL